MTEYIVTITDKITGQSYVLKVLADSKGEAIYRAKEMLLARGDFPDLYYYHVDRIH